MPELPEVETLRRELQNAVVGKKIDSVEVFWPKMIRPLSPAEFNRRLRGQKIIAAGRRAKILALGLDNQNTLLIHLKLTGQLVFSAKGAAPAGGQGPASGGKSGRLIIGGHPSPPDKFTRLIFYFSDGDRLVFNDLRKFGWLRLTPTKNLTAALPTQGLEPLSPQFSFKNFAAVLNRFPKRKIKRILMDQTLIAGLGNIYADESCFRAKILPTRAAGSLSEKEKTALHRAIVAVLKLALAKKGTSADTYVQLDGSPGGFVPHLKVYGRAGEKCRRCGGKIHKIKLNGRGTHFCPRCQR